MCTTLMQCRNISYLQFSHRPILFSITLFHTAMNTMAAICKIRITLMTKFYDIQINRFVDHNIMLLLSTKYIKRFLCLVNESSSIPLIVVCGWLAHWVAYIECLNVVYRFVPYSACKPIIIIKWIIIIFLETSA